MREMAGRPRRGRRAEGSGSAPPGSTAPRPGKFYTTTQVARLCGLSHRTIAKLFDAGVIRGYRLPGSGFRRIPEKELLSFLAALGMPIAGQEVPAMGSWLHCWEYRDLKGKGRDRCRECEIRLGHVRYCWRFSGSKLPVCLYRERGCEGCEYFRWVQPLVQPPTVPDPHPVRT
jgi:excisionase family DNA binding protein